MIGANSTIEVGGRRVRGRVYPWGVVDGMSAWLDGVYRYLCLFADKLWTVIMEVFSTELFGVCENKSKLIWCLIHS